MQESGRQEVQMCKSAKNEMNDYYFLAKYDYDYFHYIRHR